MAGLSCRYCGHPVDGALCVHCGAPAPVPGRTAASPDVSPGPSAPHSKPGHDRVPDPRTVAGSVLGAIRSRLVPEAEGLVRTPHPAWQWSAAGGVLVIVLVLLAFLMIRSCSFSLPPGGFTDPGLLNGPGPALPGSLASAACEPRDPATGVERCVVSAGDPLLSGGITDGRELVLRVQVLAPAELTQTVRQWRSAGGSVVSDGPVFVSISAASAVLYADTGSGLRIDTGTFADKAAAQAFLSRSGLLE